jgi:hypothetical protein
MNEQERIDSIIQELETESELLGDIYSTFDAGMSSGLEMAIRIIRSYYPTKEEQNDNV